MTQQTPSLNSQSRSNDERAVREIHQNLMEGWITRRADLMAGQFSEDGEMIGFDGSHLIGQQLIATHLRQIFDDHTPATFVAKVNQVQFLSPDVAMLRAIAGMLPPGQTEIMPELNAHQTVIAVKQDRRWSVALFQNTPAQFHGRPELVQQFTAELRQVLMSSHE
jgi:uncharacterized protein (TIGR02246 family)